MPDETKTRSGLLAAVKFNCHLTRCKTRGMSRSPSNARSLSVLTFTGSKSQRRSVRSTTDEVDPNQIWRAEEVLRSTTTKTSCSFDDHDFVRPRRLVRFGLENYQRGLYNQVLKTREIAPEKAYLEKKTTNNEM
ncbi:hypothetical protein RUM43_002113 [Polyplax serrata]|uniref:Uncharacterized protein n=1 Tax=Polyplax serrata TaxID=468196 RepID=A0AAN8PFJ3_POLSC